MDFSKMTDDELMAIAGESAAEVPEVIQEQHPSITGGERAIAKNFGTGPESWAAYVKQEHPDLEVKVGQGDQVLVRGQGESAYRVLDPDTGFFSKDMLADAGDILSDAVMAYGSTQATLAGGTAGAALGPGGALAGGAAAGAASSGALEAGRQGLGKLFGMPQEMAWGDVGAATAAGAISPLLFGTGAVAAKGAVPALAQKVGTAVQPAKNAVAGVLDDAGRALPGAVSRRTTDPLAGSLLETLTPQGFNDAQRGLVGRAWDGTKQKVLPWIGEMTSGVDRNAIRAAGRVGFNRVDNIAEEGLDSVAQAVQNDVNTAIRNEQGAIGREMNALRTGAGDTVAISKEAVRKPFEDLRERLLEQLDNKASPAVKEQLDDVDKILAEYFSNVNAGKVLKAGEGPQELFPQTMSPEEAFDLKGLLWDLSGLERTRGVGGPTRSLQTLAAGSERNLGKAAQDALRSVDEQMNAALAPYKNLSRRYRNVSDVQRRIQRNFKDTDTAINTLRNLRGANKRSTLQQIKKLDPALGARVEENADLVQSAMLLGPDASAMPISSKGVTSTSRSLLGPGLGVAGGYISAQAAPSDDPMTRALFMGAGGTLASMAGSPAMIRQYMKAGLGAGKATAKAQEVAPWLQMMGYSTLDKKEEK